PNHLPSSVYFTVTTPAATTPTLSLHAALPISTVSSTVTVSANASDNVGVAGVQFKLDGATLGAEDSTSPYSVSWDTTTATNGSHTLTAVARDAAGNQTTSGAVTVTVANDVTPPVISAVAASSITSSGEIGRASCREASDSQVDYGTTTAYGSSSALNDSGVASHSAVVCG